MWSITSEAERLKNIADNQALLKSLGVDESLNEYSAAAPRKGKGGRKRPLTSEEQSKENKRRREERALKLASDAPPPAPTRRSNRAAGIAADGFTLKEEEQVSQVTQSLL